MKQLHFQPIEGKSIEIIETIAQTEELASLDPDMWRAIRVVIEELVLNIVSYSGSDYIDFEIQGEEDGYTMRFRDGGYHSTLSKEKCLMSPCPWNSVR